ncbi:DNA alkylation repair protein [Streptomyces sp. NPDC005899]|uniref:DNA alkylation repair protein n=1 Tax=Streptomyces sp. NPDC005899 TaxID=3155716 RepID=UPI0033FB8A0A
MAGFRPPAAADCASIALRRRELPEREHRCVAVDHPRHHTGRCSRAVLPVARHLVTARPWWDTVDARAAHVAGPPVSAHPGPRSTTDRWAEDDDFRPVRTAPLRQLSASGSAPAPPGCPDTARTARSAPASSSARRSAGARAEYAETDARAVREFADASRHRLAPLSVGEPPENTG